MKEGWEIMKFDDVISTSQIGIVRNSKEQSADYSYRYFKMNNIRNDNGINEKSYNYIEANKQEIEKYKLCNNDFLFNTRNSYELVGKTCLFRSEINEPILFNNNILRVTFKNFLLPQFAAYAFSSELIKSQLEKMKSGTTSVVGIYYKSLKNLQIPLPPLKEQQQIVAILDKAFTAMDKAKANVAQNLLNAKQLFESYLQNVFTEKGEDWEEKTFKELSSRIGDGLHGTPKYDENGNYYFINGNNLNDGVIEIKDNTKKVNKEEFEKHKKELTENTVLISINGTLGKVAFYNNEPVILGKSACYINFNNEVNKHYIKYLVKSPLFFRNMTSQSTGATIKNFSLKSMRNYTLSLPPIQEQEKIVKKLNALQTQTKKLETIYKQKIADLEELKKSVLQKAFNGELTQQP